MDPLKLSHAEASVTLTGSLGVKVTLDDLAGLTGSLSASLTATDTPTQNPVATLDAQLDGSLGACLACWWDDGPLNATFVSGTIWKKRLWSLSQQPPAPTRPLQITTTNLPSGTAGQPYQASITANDGVTPYSWSATGLPTGLGINASTGLITGTPTQGSLNNVTLKVTDHAGTTDTTTLPLAINGPGGPNAVKQISAGTGYTCAVLGSGAAKCWGDNGYGQLGDGTTTNRPVPTQVTGLTSGVASINAGSNSAHTCAVLTSGAVRCWGNNGYGQLGDGTTINRSTPVQVFGLSDGVSSIANGDSYSCVVLTSGAVKCWGNNALGELGDGTTTNRSTPVQVIGLTSGVASISAGPQHTCAVLTTGAAKCWGFNGGGQLGDGTTTSRLTPVQVIGLASGVANIANGDSYTCAVLTSGAARCWGDNSVGELG